MHELTRLAYLEAMGVDSYVSRQALPGAAPSQRVQVVARVTPPAPPQARAPEQPPVIMPDLAVGSKKERNIAVEHRPSTATATPAVDPFSLVTIVAGGRLWLEELGQGALAREQVQLVSAMAVALGWQGPVAHAQFNWPIHNNHQLDQGQEAALDAISGFLDRQIQQHKCSAVVVLGHAARQRLGEVKLDRPQLHCEVGSADMLRDPSLKKRAWLSLAEHAERK